MLTDSAAVEAFWASVSESCADQKSGPRKPRLLGGGKSLRLGRRRLAFPYDLRGVYLDPGRSPAGVA